MDDPHARDDGPAVALLEAVIARAHIDAAEGCAEARQFLDGLTLTAEQAKARRLVELEDAPPLVVEPLPPPPPPRRALLRAELEAHGWPARPLPRGTVPALAERLGVARNTVYTDLRALAGD
jgi:transcriptional regulator of acetoin/glycerol metabolism